MNTWPAGSSCQAETNQFAVCNEEFRVNLKRFEYLFALPPATLTKLSPIA